jgi:hypothetical protein
MTGTHGTRYQRRRPPRDRAISMTISPSSKYYTWRLPSRTAFSPAARYSHCHSRRAARRLREGKEPGSPPVLSSRKPQPGMTLVLIKPCLEPSSRKSLVRSTTRTHGGRCPPTSSPEGSARSGHSPASEAGMKSENKSCCARPGPRPALLGNHKRPPNPRAITCGRHRVIRPRHPCGGRTQTPHCRRGHGCPKGISFRAPGRHPWGGSGRFVEAADSDPKISLTDFLLPATHQLRHILARLMIHCT